MRVRGSVTSLSSRVSRMIADRVVVDQAVEGLDDPADTARQEVGVTYFDDAGALDDLRGLHAVAVLVCHPHVHRIGLNGSGLLLLQDELDLRSLAGKEGRGNRHGSVGRLPDDKGGDAGLPVHGDDLDADVAHELVHVVLDRDDKRNVFQLAHRHAETDANRVRRCHGGRGDTAGQRDNTQQQSQNQQKLPYASTRAFSHQWEPPGYELRVCSRGAGQARDRTRPGGTGGTAGCA